MQILSLELKNFRCFDTLSIDLKQPIILIVGPNGTGKTSILEALHYLCYLRSFKTHIPKELVNLESYGCAITINISAQSTFDTICATISSSNESKLTKRAIKLNQKSISTYKELYSVYKVISIIEDDLQIIQGSPVYRRNYLDQMISLIDPNYNRLLKNLRQIVDNRNALLIKQSTKEDKESYLLWTEQLFNASINIQQRRISLLNQISKYALDCATQMNLSYNISLQYEYAKIYSMANISFDQFIDKYLEKLHSHEYGFKRSLFGAHLDDFSISFQDKSSRTYASRGQQKLLVILLKLAQLLILKESSSQAILLIDDFITDFDEAKIKTILSFINQLKLSNQIIITCPIKLFDINLFSDIFNTLGLQVIDLNSNTRLNLEI